MTRNVGYGNFLHHFAKEKHREGVDADAAHI